MGKFSSLDIWDQSRQHFIVVCCFDVKAVALSRTSLPSMT